jgi:hypothetical protein
LMSSSCKPTKWMPHGPPTKRPSQKHCTRVCTPRAQDFFFLCVHSDTQEVFVFDFG